MRQGTRTALALMAICCFSAAACLAQSKTAPIPGNPPPPSSPKSQPVMAQTTNIPYYTLRDGLSSILTLNNVGPTATPVTVMIYNMDGKAPALDPVTLAPHSYKEIDLSTVIPNDDFSAGNILVAYRGIEMGVTCQVSVISLERRISFESREPYEMQSMSDMMPYLSTQLAGIVSLPRPDARGYLAVTNSGTG